MKGFYFEVAGALIGLILIVAAIWMWAPVNVCSVDEDDIATCLSK